MGKCDLTAFCDLTQCLSQHSVCDIEPAGSEKAGPLLGKGHTALSYSHLVVCRPVQISGLGRDSLQEKMSFSYLSPLDDTGHAIPLVSSLSL